VAKAILDDWENELRWFVKVMPNDYRRVLERKGGNRSTGGNAGAAADGGSVAVAKKAEKKKPGGEINAEDYLEAARDHTASLSGLYAGGHYALTLYVSGLAAECLFRAFRTKKKLPFRSDHVLEPLAEEAGFPAMIQTEDRPRFDAAMADMVIRWRNNHRFRSNTAARRFLKDLALDRGIKGDFLKENARIVSSRAHELVSLGVQKWH